ncbi:GspE/PulE family protein [Limnohabitans lacus]|uniref:ATPase, T2SS/T4P/T4SS family n=1 Tax=Limnohabitans lacus TaxID=3045173 RepID=A0ABT6XB17_9BURK|nr:ATPase, T2SS/T4P/T4SS family [Limnohabitans sp. HM2-2]MDI9235188.1 ATPase, T2SS/T4P/T4SS family [Limnohabitans sp. HM2-2]
MPTASSANDASTSVGQVTEIGHAHNHVEPSDDQQVRALRDAGIPESHIQIALQRQSLTHEPLAEIMRSAEYGFLSPEGVARVQAKISHWPYFAPSQIDAIASREIQQILADKGMHITQMESMLPVGVSNGRLQLALCEPRNASKAQLLYPHWQHDFVVCSERSLQTIYRRAYAQSGKDAMELYQKLKSISLDDDGADRVLRDFVLALMRHGCYLGASDIGLTPMTSNSGGVVRYKVGGMGTVFTFLEAKIWQRVIVHLLNSAGVPAEKVKEGPVDTRFEFKDSDMDKYSEIALRYGFRVELMQRRRSENHSISCVMRILDQQAESAELDALMFDEETLHYLRDVKDRATGLMLITGPTGSGKTTTLYAMLNEIDPVERWIESIENPIEYSKGLWIQFQTDTGGSEASGAYNLLKGLLRSAPDVILFGEVRKGDIGLELVDAANTGHLAFTTMHTNDAALAIARLRSFGLDMTAVAGVLQGVLAQRLIRTLCHCASDDVRIETVTLLQNQAFLTRGQQKLKPRRAMGCIECNHSGYRGRRMIYELLKISPSVKDMIERNVAPSLIAKEGINPEYTLKANALRLVALGLTSIEEAKKLGSLEEK